jgi:hypothetical protein
MEIKKVYAPITPLANMVGVAAVDVLIKDLDQVLDENIGLSDVVALDLTSQTFKLSLLQLREFFNNLNYPVGSTYITLANVNPLGILGVGTWVATQAGSSVNSVAITDPAVGTVTGANAQAIPLREHTHGASFAGDVLATHDHTSANHTHANTVSDDISATQAGHTHLTMNSGQGALGDPPTSSNTVFSRTTPTSGVSNDYLAWITGTSGSPNVNKSNSATPAITVNGGVSIGNVGAAAMMGLRGSQLQTLIQDQQRQRSLLAAAFQLTT